jgi:hypothetical protein
MDEVDKELAKMIRETRKTAKDTAKGAGQVASAVSVLAMFQRAGVDPNALLREIRLPHEDMPRGTTSSWTRRRSSAGSERDPTPRGSTVGA